MLEGQHTYTCSKCREEKTLDKFSKDKNSSLGHTSQCKECRREMHKLWRKANPERIKELNDQNREKRREYYSDPKVKLRVRKAAIEKAFGISYEEYESMFEQQGGRCAICQGEEPCERNTHLAIDHCHITGKIRALLCSSCNRALGLFKDSVKVLESARNYLLTHNKEIHET